MRRSRLVVYLLAFAFGASAAGLAACGGGTSKALIPSADAGPLRDDFDAVGSAIDAGDCPGAEQALAHAQSHLDQLPARVSVRLRRRIQQGLNTLHNQSAKECQANQTQTVTTPTETVPTVTTPPPTTTVPTTTTPTVPTTTTPTTPTTTPTTGDNNGGVTVP